MITQISHFTSVALTKNGKQCIYLCSKDKAFLDRALETLREYTKNIDPVVEIKTKNVKEIDGSFRVNIQNILPRPIARFYDGRFVIKDEYSCYPYLYHNCHGAALLASGVFPLLAFFNHPFKTEEMIRVPLNEIRAGDLVYLSGGNHSFVFLSHELCLSKNGRSREAQLKLHSTNEVLKIYWFPEDSLTKDTNNPVQKVMVFRKKSSENLFEPILSELLDYTVLYEQANKRAFPCKTEEASRMIEILITLKSHITTLLKTHPEKKEFLDFVYSLFAKRLDTILNCCCTDHPTKEFNTPPVAVVKKGPSYINLILPILFYVLFGRLDLE